MDEQVAQIIIAFGAAVGLLFWLIGIGLYRKMANAETERRFEAELPNRSPSEAIDELLGEKQFFSAESRVQRPEPSRLVVAEKGVEISFEATRYGSASRVTAVVDDSRMTRRFQFWLGVLVLIVIPIYVGGLCVALWHFVAPSPTAAVRWQSVQVVQIIHALWPQFLVYGLWRAFHTRVGNIVANMLVYAQAGRPDRRQV
jgi:hypothetical protein